MLSISNLRAEVDGHCVAVDLGHRAQTVEVVADPVTDVEYLHDHLGGGHLLEGRIDRDTEEPVVATHLTALVADERDVVARDALEHLVGADGVEGGELREQRDGDLHGHAS